MSPAPTERLKKLCDLAVAMGYINFSQADEVLSGGAAETDELGRVLADKGWITVEQLRELQKEMGRWEGSTARYVPSPAGAPPPAPPARPAPAPSPPPAPPQAATPPEKQDEFLQQIISRRRSMSEVEEKRVASATARAELQAVEREVGRAVNIVVGAPVMAGVGFLQRQWKLVGGAVAVLVLIGVVVWFINGITEKSNRIGAALIDARKDEQDGNFAESKRKFQAILEFDPGNAAATEGIARIDAEIKRRATDAEAEAARRREHEQVLRQYDQARAGIEQAYRLYTFDDPDPRDVTREADAAERNVTAAMAKLPAQAEMHLILGHAWLLRGAPDKAEAAFKKALELDPKYAPAHYQIGRLRFVQILTASALGTPTADEARKMAPWTEEADRELTQGAMLVDDLQRRVAALMKDYLRGRMEDVQYKAVVGSEQVGGRAGVFELYWLAGLSGATPEKRMEYLDRALRLSPHQPLLLYCRGKAHDAAKDHRKAADDFARAVRMNPAFGAGFAALGLAHSRLGRTAEAVADFKKALELEPAGGMLRAKLEKYAAGAKPD